MSLVTDGFLTPVGFVQMTSLGSAVGLAALPVGARYALIEADHTAGQNIRWRDDGNAPTATVGMTIFQSGNPLWYTGDLTKIQLIQEVSGAIANITYYEG